MTRSGNNSDRPRAGFTLLELLVVVGIIAILVALLFPAVNAIRNASRMTQCKNSLRQIALGMLSYESANSVFPPGQVTPENETREFIVDFSKSSMVGHLGFALPFMEQSSLRRNIEGFSWGLDDVVPPWYESSDNLEMANVTLSLFRCPSDFETRIDGLLIYTFPVGPRGQLSNDRIPIASDYQGWTNYLGSMGSVVESAGQLENDGIFYGRSRIRLADIVDGLSNTILLGEVLGGAEGIDERRVVDARHSFLTNGIPAHGFLFDPSDDTVDDLAFMFSSRHQNGHAANFAFADGSVSVIANGDERAVRELVRGLTSRNDGVVDRE